MAAWVITCIETALDLLENRHSYRWMSELDSYEQIKLDWVIAITVPKLRALRTFLLCSTILEERLLLCSNDKASSTLVSLLVRIESVVAEISVNQSSPLELTKYLVRVESFEEELEQWYTSFSDYFLQSSSPASPDQVWDIANSVVENLNDILAIHDGALAILIEPLKENITLLRNFIRFATLLCADEKQEFCDFLTVIQPLAISSAHATVLLFSSIHYSAEDFMDVATSEEEMVPYLELMSNIKTINDPHLYESYTLALESFKESRQWCVSQLDLNNFTAFLLSTVWEMLQLDTAPVVSLKDKLQVLYEGLRFLTIVLEKKLNESVGKIRDIAGFVAFDAGVIIFSLYERNFAIDDGLRDFVENIQVIRSEVQTSKFNFPKTTILGFLEFLLDYLTDVSSHSDYVSIIREHLDLLKSYMVKVVELRNQQEELHQAVWSLAVEVELLIDHLVLGSALDSFPASIQSIEKDMEIIKEDFKKISDHGKQETTVQIVTWTSTDQGPSQSSNPAADDVVGFKTEISPIINRLVRGSKGLKVVAIVGMPGSGKTTLANMVYNDCEVELHFHIRARCSVSQVFNIRKTILELLKQTKPQATVDSDADDLPEQLWRSLKGNRYLILIDDIWERQAFDCLKQYFPDDSNGSRLLLTSRNGEVAPEAIADDDKPHHLRQLTESESLGLLQKKLFAGDGWPSQSMLEFGKEVAEHCKGLPLTIVIVAGILASTGQEGWKGVLESLRSGISTTLTDECINSIELSYKHLPHHLKPCFLSFGAFPEDHLVSVKNLIWQWIAEGFVRKSDSNRLERIATDYLNILIGRSLVMKAGERSGGGVKECRMHDLLHDFCLRKANEESFLHVLSKEPLSLSELGNLRRLCIHSGAEHFKESKLSCPHLRSLSFFDAADNSKRHDMSFIFRISKHLRVLAMDQVGLAHLPSREIGFLVQLRYLAIQVDYQVSPSIGNLTNLETLFLCPSYGLTKLPDTFWNLKKLRHLFSGNSSSDFDSIELPSNNLDSSCNLVELDSLSALSITTPDIVEIQLRKFPNIRRLKFDIPRDPLKVLSFSFLSKLESLSSQYSKLNSTELKFPESVKKLSFDVCELPVDFFSTIAKLPNLEVLKVSCCIYYENSWHMEEGEFSELKYLELIGLNIVRWTAESEDQFPNLEELRLTGCDQLVEIPEESLSRAPLLKKIDAADWWKSGRIISLVKKVAGVQEEYGNSVQVRVRNIGKGVSEDVEVSDEEEILGMGVSEDVEVSDKEEEILGMGVSEDYHQWAAYPAQGLAGVHAGADPFHGGHGFADPWEYRHAWWRRPFSWRHASSMWRS